MKLAEVAQKLGMDLMALKTALIEEYEDVDDWDEVPDYAMPKLQATMDKAAEIKEMANVFSLPAASVNGNGHTNDDSHLPESEALTIAHEYGVSIDFVYAVKNAEIQLQLDAETEFKSGMVEAELLIAAKETGKALVFEAYDANRRQARQQRIESIQSIKSNGLDFLRQKYGVDSQARASQANERFTQVKQQLDALDVDVESFFARK